MNPLHDFQNLATRTAILGATAGDLGTPALSSLLSSHQLALASGATGYASAAQRCNPI